MTLELEYRRTFIDVVEKPKFLIRYHSLPAFGTPTDTCEDATLTDYVLKLSGSNVRADRPKHPETKVESQVSSRASIESLGSIESIGSMGHGWGLCKRPCALYLSGHCKHGADCGFCHLSHQYRLPKLDKQQREKLKMLSVSQLLSLILEPLKMKVAEQRIENEAAEIMGLIELEAAKARCAEGKEARPGARAISKKTSGANRVLAKMSIAGLIGVAGCNQADSSEFRQQIMEALERLRRKVAGKA